MRPARPITLLLTLALTAPAWSQEQPPHHRRHHHHHTAPARTAPPPAQAAAEPDPTAPTPAPVPNANVNAPQQTPPEGRPSIEPGNVQLHLPESGDGFLPGSTADHGDNERAPVVPGVSIVVPLGQAPPAQ